MRTFKHKLGERFGNLTLMGRMRHGASWRWMMLCDCGTLTTKKQSNVTSGRTTSCGNHGHGLGRRDMDQLPSYNVAHNVVAMMKGKASEYTCTDCPRPAEEWSYDNNDRNELYGAKCANDTHLMPYSLDIEHYEPRCRKCHRQFDAGVRAA